MGRLPPGLGVEVRVEDLASAKDAELGGATSVEICADLLDGGTTPSVGTVELARRRLRIPVHVLIRPRTGDYTYDDDELAIMLRDIRSAAAARASGITFGLLDRSGRVDRDRCRVFIDFARPLAVTFGLAFDLAPDPEAALDAVIECGFDRVVTSGRQRDAWEGRALVQSLVARSAQRVQVMAGGDLDEVLAPAAVSATRATAIQVGLGVASESAPPGLSDAANDIHAARPPLRRGVDLARVRVLVEHLAGGEARAPDPSQRGRA